VNITGDNGQKQNGFSYDVWGKDANCSRTNSTWVQKNCDTKRERKIFRYELKDAIPFPIE